MALEAAVQGGAGELWDGRLQGVEAIIQRQERVAAEGDDDSFLLNGERGGMCLARPGGQISDGGALAPLAIVLGFTQ